MQKHLILVALLALLTTSVRADALLCKDFLTMSEPIQKAFVSGLVDGMRTMHGVNATFARLLKSAATSAEEQSGIEKLKSVPQQYLSKGDSLSKAEITSKISKGCKIKPELPVGNYLTDVMSGEI
jgi:hypothetical protein